MIDAQRLLSTFLSLVMIDSPSGEEQAFADELRSRLEALGAQVEHDAYGNLIAHLGNGPFPFLLGAHMDTVEPGRGIRPLVADGVVQTDGTTVLGGDPKAGVAAILEALTARADAGQPHPALDLVFTRGEESGLEGSANLDYSMLRAKRGAEFDGEGPVSDVTIEAPARISARLRFKGRGAHAGTEPEKGISAIEMAAMFVSGFPQGRIDAETTANIGTIQGGSAPNAVPEEATLSAEARSRDPAKLEHVREQFLDLVAQVREAFPDGHVEYELREEFGGYRMDPGHPAVQLVTSALKKAGLPTNLIKSGGATDANNYARHGIDVVVVGLGGRDFHTVRESILVSNLVDAARFCAALLDELAQA